MPLRFRLLSFLALLPAPLLAQAPVVVTDTHVTHSLVSQVMHGVAEPILLLDQGGDPHHVQLRPSQARAIATADIVVTMSHALSPWMETATANRAPDSVIELAQIEGTHRLPLSADHDHDHGHDDHDHDHNDAAEYDPHLWLDPANAALWVRALATSLALRDPAHAAVYSANADRAAGQIETLAADLRAILAPAQDVGLVFYHDAYAYLADTYDLRVLGTITATDAATPGAARLSALRTTLAHSDATCLFPEVNHADDYAAVVHEGTALRMGAALDPSGVALDPGAGLYDRLMRDVAATIAACARGD